MKTIVTHIAPDTDALASIWLIKRFLGGWSNAIVKFVPAGKTLNDAKPDEFPDIIHVDTGLGMFDHHQTNKETCAAKKVFYFLRDKGAIKKSLEEPLERITEVVTQIDHFKEVFLEEPDRDIYDFLISNIIDGVRIKTNDDQRLVEIVLPLFDGLLVIFSNKIKAEQELKAGFIFKSKWGKVLAIESENEDVSRLAQKRGFQMVVRKSKKKGYLKIKTLPLKKLNLKKIYQILSKKDPAATWYFHPSGHILLNGSTKNPDMKPTSLTLPQVVEIVKNIK